MAIDFLCRHRLHDRPCRFDVIAIDVSASPPAVEVYTNAFDAGAM
jgi:Holliday junction resolvase-like predicted endonuclease